MLDYFGNVSTRGNEALGVWQCERSLCGWPWEANKFVSNAILKGKTQQGIIQISITIFRTSFGYLGW